MVLIVGMCFVAELGMKSELAIDSSIDSLVIEACFISIVNANEIIGKA